jgi:pimeloyl-ACP methyl ester carboxylesterase
MTTRKWVVAILTLFALGCESAASQARPTTTNRAEPEEVAARSTARSSGPVRVEVLPAVEPPVFVLRGRDVGPDKLVFLHGMCGHGLGYAQSFQHAAARRGTLIAPQADVVCGEGPGAKWSQDVAALDARITAAFRALGFSEPITDICVLGMSQGATRAAALARAFPERYTRLVSMGAPTAVDPSGLTRLRSAVLMVGSRERKDLMRSSEQALQRKGVPAKSLVIPDADHAGMGPSPEQTMAEALGWLWDNARPATLAK